MCCFLLEAIFDTSLTHNCHKKKRPLKVEISYIFWLLRQNIIVVKKLTPISTVIQRSEPLITLAFDYEYAYQALKISILKTNNLKQVKQLSELMLLQKHCVICIFQN